MTIDRPDRRRACPLGLDLDLDHDHDQRRGFVVWDSSCVGGSMKLRREDTDWKIETVDDWIT